MPEVNGDAALYEPYKNFRFRVNWDNHDVAGVSKVSALGRSTDVIEHRVGGDPSTTRKSPGITHFEPITLERGVTHDDDFVRWANQVWYKLGKEPTEVSLKNFRKDLLIFVYNEAGQKVLEFKCFNCWVSDFRALGDLDSNANAVVFEAITLQNEGWIRNAVSPPTPPSYDIPPVS
jgi:phage tail-like protein